VSGEKGDTAAAASELISSNINSKFQDISADYPQFKIARSTSASVFAALSGLSYIVSGTPGTTQFWGFKVIFYSYDEPLKCKYQSNNTRFYNLNFRTINRKNGIWITECQQTERTNVTGPDPVFKLEFINGTSFEFKTYLDGGHMLSSQMNVVGVKEAVDRFD